MVVGDWMDRQDETGTVWMFGDRTEEPDMGHGTSARA